MLTQNIRGIRRGLRLQLAQLAREESALEERDLRSERRAELKHGIRQRALEAYEAARREATALVDAETRELEARTPEAKRVLGAYSRPERAAAMLALLREVPAADLPAFARLAARDGDDSTAWALVQVLGMKTDVGDAATAVMAALDNGASSDDRRLFGDVVAARHELAGIVADASQFGALAEPRVALAAAHEAGTLKLGARVHRFTDEAVAGAYALAGVPRAIEKASPGHWPPMAEAGGTMVPIASAAE